MTLANTHANFGARIFHSKTLDGLAEGIARYVPADKCSVLLSDRASRIASWLIRRGNVARGLGTQSSFEARYDTICELARRKYPLPLETMPHWIADENRLAALAPRPNYRFSETGRVASNEEGGGL